MNQIRLHHLAEEPQAAQLMGTSSSSTNPTKSADFEGRRSISGLASYQARQAQAKVYQIRLLEPFPVDPNLPVNSRSTRTCLDLIRFRADGIPPTLSLFELIKA